MTKLPVLQDRSAVACCEPLSATALGADDAATLAPLLKALSDPVRLRLFSLIASANGGEACVCDLTPQFDVSGPTISHHLKVLREAGLITGERRGTWIYYRPVRERLRELAAVLEPAGNTDLPLAAATSS